MNNVTVYRVGRDRFVITGDPCEGKTADGDSMHNCDYMGCGSDHVIARGVMDRCDNDDPDWNRSRAMLDEMARAHGFTLVPCDS